MFRDTQIANVSLAVLAGCEIYSVRTVLLVILNEVETFPLFSVACVLS